MAGNRGLRRTLATPGGYKLDPGGRVAMFNQTYVGFVMDNTDALRMGRLKVWIPEFSSDKKDPHKWFTVNYCSPFAGATPISKNVRDGKTLADTQQSYGWWAVPPDLENEVVVQFINGDPNRGIWIGALYQQFMNHMVPGIGSNTSFDEGVEGVPPPVAEYNKWSDVGMGAEPSRPRYEPLHEALKNQGLYEDSNRGPSTSSARRDDPKVYGFLSPGGSQLVFDDAEGNKFIRLRTANGAQILINDTTGYVYMISRSGNSWFELSDDGIDMYTAKSYSIRAQEDINFHADGNINMYAKKGMNTYAGGSYSVQAGKSLDVLAGQTLNLSANGAMNLLTNNNLNVTAGGTLGLSADGTLALKSGGAMGVASGGTLTMSGSKIQQNNGSGPKPTKATEAKAPQPTEQLDRELNVSTNYSEIQTRTIVSRLPTHEPWDLHPGVSSAPAIKPVDTTSSTRLQADGNAPVESSGNDLKPGEEEQAIKTDNSPFIMPTTGTVTSLYGMRVHPVNGVRRLHAGIDIANKTGTPVVASKDGKVTRLGVGQGYGNRIVVDHGNGTSTLYAHLSAFKCSNGQQVKQGQVIGLLGNTGVGTGPHLHFEIRQGGSPTNPASKLPGISKGARVTTGRGK